MHYIADGSGGWGREHLLLTKMSFDIFAAIHLEGMILIAELPRREKRFKYFLHMCSDHEYQPAVVWIKSTDAGMLKGQAISYLITTT